MKGYKFSMKSIHHPNDTTMMYGTNSKFSTSETKHIDNLNSNEKFLTPSKFEE